MPRRDPLGNLVQSIDKEGCYKDIYVVPQTSGSRTNEISPSVASSRQCDCCNIHPRLKEMEPADIGLPIRRYAQDKNKETSAGNDEPIRNSKMLIFPLHIMGVRRWLRKSSFEHMDQQVDLRLRISSRANGAAFRLARSRGKSMDECSLLKLHTQSSTVESTQHYSFFCVKNL